MRKFVNFVSDLRFGFSELDAYLNGWEMLGTVILGIVICAAPFVIKWILGVVL